MMWWWVGYYIFAFLLVTATYLVAWHHGRAYERKLARERKERRIAAGIERRAVAREGTTPARISRARISGSTMEE